MDQMTASALLTQLQRHYRPEGRVSRELVGHEIKVSRAGLLAELADPTKSDPWQRYCDRWWLVVPHPGLLHDITLPATWGVLTPPSGRRTRSMTVHSPAPKLVPDEQGPALRTVATWLHWRLHRARNEHDQTTRPLDQVRRDRDQLRLQMPHQNLDSQHEVELVHQIIRELGGTHYPDRIGDWYTHVSVGDVVAALRDLAEARAQLEDVRRQIRHGRNRLHDFVTAAQHVLIEDDKAAALWGRTGRAAGLIPAAEAKESFLCRTRTVGR